ncbi:MAG TPA: MbtH family protein [Nocardiopsis listeri]|uniref:MbtH family protein n=1 Tax=Nocardiopsis listeri TaxID=53440 RepID=UPI001D391EAC|nr:MbtH family protein [Nocardiopsis listeri]HJE61383.1 MbtH family protein [Nocardiopsis listeri]
MSNPFENDDAQYLVLINAEGQHSLWPSFAEIPQGWDIALEATSRANALEYVEENWTDMRPAGLVAALEG